MSSLRYWGAGTLLSLILVPVLVTPASAQIIVGSGGRPQVEVDTTVLDRLGKEPTLPDLFLGGSAAPRKSLVGEPASGRTPGLHPPHPIVLKRPVHKAPKAKPTTTAAKTPVTQVAGASQAVAVPSAEPKPDGTPADATKPTAEQNPPSVSLPTIVPQAAQTAAKHDNKAETKAAGTAVVAGKSEPQPAPPAPPKLPATPTPPLPDKPMPPAPAASTGPVPAPDTVTTAPPATTAPVTLTPAVTPPTTVAQAPAAAPEAGTPTSTAPASPPAPPAPQEAHLTPTAPSNTPSAAPSAASGGIEAPLTILFEKDGARLPDDVRTSLTQLADRLAGDTVLQVQLLAYAEGDEDNASKARRLSLSRALAVRSFLIDQGVRSTRIEVRALGNKIPEGPADRVDILVQKR